MVQSLRLTSIHIADAGRGEKTRWSAIGTEEIDGYLVLPASLEDTEARYVSGGSPNSDGNNLRPGPRRTRSLQLL